MLLGRQIGTNLDRCPLATTGSAGIDAVLNVFHQFVNVSVGAALNHGVAHSNKGVMEAVLGSCTAVGVNIEVMGRFPVIEVLGQHAVFDEDFFSGVHAFIVHGIGAITTHHGGVVDHGDQFVANLLTEFSIQARIARATKSASHGWPKAS